MASGHGKLPVRQPAVPPKPATEAEIRARSYQQENLGRACQRLVHTDLYTPFTNVADAVQRLLPFHVLASYEGEEADLDEAEGTSTPGHLACSRDDAWNDLCLRKTIELSNRAQTAIAKIEAAERAMAEDPVTAVDRYLVEQLMLADSRRALLEEKQRNIAAMTH